MAQFGIVVAGIVDMVNLGFERPIDRLLQIQIDSQADILAGSWLIALENPNRLARNIDLARFQTSFARKLIVQVGFDPRITDPLKRGVIALLSERFGFL